MSLNNVKVVKKDGTKEEFNVQKVVVAVNQIFYRHIPENPLTFYTG